MCSVRSSPPAQRWGRIEAVISRALSTMGILFIAGSRTRGSPTGPTPSASVLLWWGWVGGQRLWGESDPTEVTVSPRRVGRRGPNPLPVCPRPGVAQHWPYCTVVDEGGCRPRAGLCWFPEGRVALQGRKWQRKAEVLQRGAAFVPNPHFLCAGLRVC